MNKKNKNFQSGFIALMATIIISLILLVMALEEGASGYHARFNILGTEAKEQAVALAEGCADQATANLITDPNYAGNSTTTLSAGICHIFPIALHSPAPGLATVKTQAEVRGSYANLAITLNMNNLHLGGTPVSPTTGTLVVYTAVYNNNGGTKTPSDFTMNIFGNSPSPSSFSGTVAGKAITLGVGAYSASASAISGYSSSYSSGCVGTIAAGDLKYCVVAESDAATTLTLLVNVKNDNGGTKSPSDFSLFIDGTTATNGARYPMSAASHHASTTPVAGYAFSTWGGDCAADGTINLATGDNKTCIVNFDDNPPPSVACADTVMMLARSMNTGELADEGTAAKSLLDLYSQVSPSPKAGVGSYDGLNGSPAQVPAGGQLAFVTGSTTVAVSKSGIYDQWISSTGNPANKVADVVTADGDANYISAGTNGFVQTFSLQNANIPAGATINSVVLYAVAAAQGGSGTSNIIFRVERGSGVPNQRDDAGHAITSAYSTISRAMYLNPFTGSAWTLAEVNGWASTYGFGVKRNATGTAVPKVSKIYAVVSYSTTVPGLYGSIAGTTAPGKDVSAGIIAGNNELNSARHRAGFSKVLILVSPSGGIGNPGEIAASSSANTAKTGGTEIFTINFTGGSNSDFWAGLATNSLNDHSGNAALENADGDHFFVAPSSSDMPAIFQTIANLACPAIAAPPPPTPPTTGKLIIHEYMVNDNGGTKSPSDFTVHITGGSPSPAGPFTGATLLSDVNVTLNPGAYNVTEDAMTGYNELMGANCMGTIASGETKLCTIINDDVPPLPPPPNFDVTIGEWEEVSTGG